MEEYTKKILSFLASALFSYLLANLGTFILWKFPENSIIGLIAILISFSFLYIAYFALQIGSHQEKIQNIEKWIENNEQTLYTLKDIVILKKISEIK